MSEISLIFVLHLKTNKTLNDMAQIQSEKHTPFGDFFSIMEQFDAFLAQTIDSTLVNYALPGRGFRVCLMAAVT